MQQDYFQRHIAVYKARGNAADQQCVECGKSARHWAQVHDTDGNDPWTDYRPMCSKCHVAYDRGGISPSPETIAARALGIHNVIRADNTSGVPGVHRHSQSGKWVVQVKHRHGGTYDDLRDAIRARNAMAREIYGPEAKIYPV